jgi:hypothetical protein
MTGLMTVAQFGPVTGTTMTALNDNEKASLQHNIYVSLTFVVIT